MNGLYELSVNSPMGVIKGNLNLAVNGNNITGYIEINGKRNSFNNGVVTGNNKFSLSGTIKALFKTINYNVDGEVVNNTINLYAKTNMGNFSLSGKKIS